MSPGPTSPAATASAGGRQLPDGGLQVRGDLGRDPVERPDLLELVDALHVGEDLDERGVHGEDARAGVAQLVRQLLAAQGGVQRHGDGAHPGGAEDEIEQLDAVLAHERDAVAPRDAGRLQQAGRAGGRVARPREGPLDRAHAQQRLVAVALRLALEQRGERLLRQRQPAERRPVEGRRSVVVLPIRRTDGSRHPVISSRRAGSSRGCTRGPSPACSRRCSRW